MELTGKIISIMEAMSGPTAHNGHCYMSQDYVLEVSGIFPRHCKFRIFGEDRIKQFNIQVGEELTVLFNIEAKEYNGKWFNDIRAYNMIRTPMQPTEPPNMDNLQVMDSETPVLPYTKTDDDQLPF